MLHERKLVLSMHNVFGSKTYYWIKMFLDVQIKKWKITGKIEKNIFFDFFPANFSDNMKAIKLVLCLKCSTSSALSNVQLHVPEIDEKILFSNCDQ